VRILFVSRCPPNPLHFGDRLLLHRLTQGLAARGHELELIALSLDLAAGNRTVGDSQFNRVETVFERRRSRPDYLFRLLRPFPDSARRCWNPELWRRTKARIDSSAFDLVHVFGGIQVYEIRNLITSNLPTVIQPFDSMTLLYRRRLRLLNGNLKRILAYGEAAIARAYERRIYRGFGRVILVSPVDKASIETLDPDLPAVVIPNGVNLPDRPVRRQQAGAATLVFVGNFEYDPNVDSANTLKSDIFPRLLETIPSARLLLVGANPPDRLRMSADERVTITGYVPDVRPYLRQATAFVSPLRAGSGIRNKILEAMSEGTPVVATRMSCEGIRVVDQVNVILAETPAEMASSIQKLVDSRDLQTRIGYAGRQLVERDHQWRSVVLRYEELYADTVSEFAGGRS
jgi:glycosyltransferase involved in cell wall biosynthesis